MVRSVLAVLQPERSKERFDQLVGERAFTELLSDLKFIQKMKHPDEHSSDRQQVGRGGSTSGFYEVPMDMRRRAGNEEAELFDPKHVNFRKIKELFEKAALRNQLLRHYHYQADDPDTAQKRNQLLRHYNYHLRSFAEREGEGDVIEGFRRPFLEDSQFRARVENIIGYGHVSEPSSHGHLLGSPILWAHIFLSDLFHRSSQGELSATDDPECAHLWVSELWADLLLLENQIPLLICNPSKLFRYFEDFIPLRLKSWNQSTHYYHILHLIHDLLLPMISRSKPGSHPLAWFRSCRGELAAPWRMKSVLRWLLNSPFLEWLGNSKEKAPLSMKPVPTATRLQQAGIKFKPVDDEGFVVEFKRGVLKLPRLHITKCTKKVLMNLIAWELCHNKAAKYFINYAIFMDHLINTSKDVDILIQSGVIEHSLATDEEVAALFNGLSQDLVYTKNEPENEEYNIFPKLSLDIKKYCKSRGNVWLANLMQDYFKSPWSILSLIAAVLIILLTLAQTFFSAYSYFRPPK